MNHLTGSERSQLRLKLDLLFDKRTYPQSSLNFLLMACCFSSTREVNMQGFQRLNRQQWALVRPLFHKPLSNKFGRKDLSPKKIMNTILWVLITGARWIDVPIGPRWAPRSTAHEWLGHWQETGLLEKVLNLLLDTTEGLKLTGFDRLKVDGFFRRDEEEKKWHTATMGKGSQTTCL